MGELKKFAFQAVGLILLIFISLSVMRVGNPNGLFQIENPKFGEVTIDGIPFSVEIADTPAKRQKGLGGKLKLDEDKGMIFIYTDEDKYSYWMKGMNFPIDIIWIRDNRVVDLTVNALPPSPGEKDADLNVYVPSQPVDMVLEVNTGFVEQYNVQLGDKIEFKRK